MVPAVIQDKHRGTPPPQTAPGLGWWWLLRGVCRGHMAPRQGGRSSQEVQDSPGTKECQRTEANVVETKLLTTNPFFLPIMDCVETT